jgi:hypothetical protein
MSWSEDQRKLSLLDQRAVGVEQLSEHPAKTLMARRWQDLRARVGEPLSEPTQSRVQTLSVRSHVTQAGSKPKPPPIPAIARTARSRPFEHASQAPQPLAEISAVQTGPQLPPADGPLPGVASHRLAYDSPAWMRSPERALLLVAVVSCSTLLALLYFGGFLG